MATTHTKKQGGTSEQHAKAGSQSHKNQSNSGSQHKGSKANRHRSAQSQRPIILSQLA